MHFGENIALQRFHFRYAHRQSSAKSGIIARLPCHRLFTPKSSDTIYHTAKITSRKGKTTYLCQYVNSQLFTIIFLREDSTVIFDNIIEGF